MASAPGSREGCPVVIRSVEFVGSVASPDQPPPSRLPQVAFAGRSNVGKSSLINRLLGRPRRRIARVSSSPGKTQTLNFYEVNRSFLLVDLPGSGYARAPAAVRDAWQRLVRGYLAGSEELRGVVYLVDSRHPPTTGDREFVEYLAGTGAPTLIALTKVDKLKASDRARGLPAPAVLEDLGVPGEQVVASSARTGEGAEELLNAIAALLEMEEGS